MITMALCEDNDLQREMMQEMLKEFAKTKAVTFKLFSSGEDLLAHVRAHGSFDIYILDVIMPGINGMEVAMTLRQMRDRNIIIFTTSSLEYAPMSYDVEAFHYLTKPVDSDKFFRVLNKACANLDTIDDSLEIRTRGGDTMRISVKNVMSVELKDRSPIYHLSDGTIREGVKLRGTFRDAVSPLLCQNDFIMCGVGLLVNLKYVSAIDSESLLLNNGQQLFFPKSAYSELKSAWKKRGK